MTRAATVILDVPPLPCVVPEGVFDAWCWCASDRITWRRPDHASGALPAGRPIAGDNPPDLVFVLHPDAAAPFLPTELARLHAFGYGLDDGVRALAPWAIDDATDLLHANRARPRDVLWLAASSLEALVWGLHDWVHFHNHGPFDRPAMTELQCDLVALAWLRLNAERIGIDAGELARIGGERAALGRRRFADEGERVPADLERLFAGPYPAALERPVEHF